MRLLVCVLTGLLLYGGYARGNDRLEHFQHLIGDVPYSDFEDDNTLYYVRGMMYYGDKMYTAALQDFQRISSTYYCQAWFLAGSIQLNRKQYKEAEESFRKFVQNYNGYNSSTIWRKNLNRTGVACLAYCAARNGKIDEAKRLALTYGDECDTKEECLTLARLDYYIAQQTGNLYYAQRALQRCHYLLGALDTENAWVYQIIINTKVLMADHPHCTPELADNLLRSTCQDACKALELDHLPTSVQNDIGMFFHRCGHYANAEVMFWQAKVITWYNSKEDRLIAQHNYNMMRDMRRRGVRTADPYMECGCHNLKYKIHFIYGEIYDKEIDNE